MAHLGFFFLQSSEELSAHVDALGLEKAGLVERVSQKEVELAGLGEELERLQSSLATERESGRKAAEALQNQLNEKVCVYVLGRMCEIEQSPFMLRPVLVVVFMGNRG